MTDIWGPLVIIDLVRTDRPARSVEPAQPAPTLPPLISLSLTRDCEDDAVASAFAVVFARWLWGWPHPWLVQVGGVALGVGEQREEVVVDLAAR